MDSGTLARRAALRRLTTDIATFSRALYPSRSLRAYQLEAIAAFVDAVMRGQGGSYSMLFSRQSGKDETLAQLEAFFLNYYRFRGGNAVVAAPTFKPQCLVSIRRLKARLDTPLHGQATPSQGYRVELGKAGVSFMSTEPTANARGETADIFLAGNEAQDITTERWDPVFAPMAASTNAPSLFSGTPWMQGSLLSRQRDISRQSATLYEADWQRVALEVPAYGAHVRERIAQLGENHPFILTEYSLKELGDQGGLFPATRQAQMKGGHPRSQAHAALAGKTYSLLLDVAGGDEDQEDDPAARGREKRRDSTALTVVEVDLTTVPDPLIARPAYRVVDRYEWIGVKHTSLYQTLLDLARNVWHARYIIVDATGIGAGLASFLTAAFARSRCIVIPFIFGLSTKSKLGWDFLGIVESGRYKEYLNDDRSDTNAFWQQVSACQYTVDPGPGKIMRWSVPTSRGHDDFLMSAALCAVLDEQDWTPRIVTGRTREDL